MPASLLRILRRAYPKKKTGRFLGIALRDPFFPITFLIRNFIVLQGEWQKNPLPFRQRKAQMSRVFSERIHFFLETRKRGEHHRDRNSEKLLLPQKETLLADHYCTHCGGCCEIASGLPEFPPEVPLPQSWREIFGNGLGQGHRFCPFLWEIRGTGRSLCAIHPWRPLPCRTFEREECEYLRKDTDFLAMKRLMARL